VGGAGFADHWFRSTDDEPQWRDTMVRVEGEAATGLQAVFAENWLETAGEIITGPAYFPFAKAPTETIAMVVGSTPTTGRSTDARILFQMLLDSASKRIWITTPYFLPDRSIREELKRAVKRGVDVKVIVPGRHNDHLLTRRSSRRLYGELLESGARIYEYEPAMIHTKSMIVDGLWGIVGSTNMDSRSFGLNDEVNLAVLDPVIAARLERDFNLDLSRSHQVTYEQWKKRSVLERVHEWVGALLERQQ
jgi:cardiolipin synthase